MTEEDAKKYCKGFSTPEACWSRFGAYYAMFPVDFAFDVISKHSKPGDKILDPFCGRGTSVYVASVLGRSATGIDINPLAYIFSSVKLKPAPKEKVLARLKEIYDSSFAFNKMANNYDEFFKMCYCNEVLKFLLCARENLKWEKDFIDRTLMAFIALHLHDKLGSGLSNQMKMTKSLSKNYSIQWWKDNGLENPPKINPYEMLRDKIERRYSKGVPNYLSSEIKFGDSCAITQKMIEKNKNRFSLLFTSPPYCGITDYFMDQWLRLWLLGGTPNPVPSKDSHKGRFVNKDNYAKMLDDIFHNCAMLMSEDSCVYVRTDSREFTMQTTLDVLKRNFPKHNIEIRKKPVRENVKTQTDVCGNKSNQRGEVDIILCNG